MLLCFHTLKVHNTCWSFAHNLCLFVKFCLESISPLTKDDLPSILNHLKSVTKWHSLGMVFVQDQVQDERTPHIQQNFPVDSLESMILYWLESGPKENHTWKYLVTALKKIGEDSVANYILRMEKIKEDSFILRQHTSSTNERSGNMVTNSLALKVAINYDNIGVATVNSNPPAIPPKQKHRIPTTEPLDKV